MHLPRATSLNIHETPPRYSVRYDGSKQQTHIALLLVIHGYLSVAWKGDRATTGFSETHNVSCKGGGTGCKRGRFRQILDPSFGGISSGTNVI